MGQGGIITRITTATGLFQFFAVLSSGAVSITSDVAVPQNEPVLLYGEYDRFDAAQRLKIRVGETQKTAESVSASMSNAAAPYHAIGQEKASGATYPLKGTLSMVGIFERTLPRAYTDTLSRAFISPSTFATIGTEMLDNAFLIADIVAAIDGSTTGVNAAAAASQSLTAAEEIAKVPRAEEPVAAGAAVRRRNQRDQYVDEIIEPPGS